jgi:nucleotide-binding universal stress UspA family protein
MEALMFQHVIAGVDGGPGGRDAIALATRLTAPNGRLGLAHVYNQTISGMMAYAITGTNAHADRDQAMQLLERDSEATGVQARLICQPSSSMGRGLHDVAERTQADLLVVGSSRRGFPGRVLTGDGTHATLNGAPCAVAIAPVGYADTAGPIATIGVAYCETPDSQAALALARDLAPTCDARLRALEVVELPNGPYGFGAGYLVVDVMRDLQRAAQERLDALDGVEGRAVSGLAGEELSAFSGEVDLLVTGSRGFGPVKRLILGSTSAHMVRHARCPLIVIPRTAAAESAVETRSGAGAALS